MRPTSFKETNKVMLSGGNPNTDQLPIAFCTNPDIEGRTFIISKWKLSPEEMELLKETGSIWISIMAPTMPPIMPLVINPFEELGYKPIEI